MEVDTEEPASVNKNPTVIKGAQEDAAKLDILVCGSCRNVFHFIEEFKEHKQEPCPVSTFSAQETKPQVWAFLLWKSAVVNKERLEGGIGNVNSWKMYQRWCKMEDGVRDNWIAAGRALQSFSVIGSAKLQEVRMQNDGKTRNTSARPGEEADVKNEISVDLKQSQKKSSNRPFLVEKANSDTSKQGNQLESWNNSHVEDSIHKKSLSAPSVSKQDGHDPDKENLETKDVSHELSDGVHSESGKKVSLDNDDTIEIKEEKLSEEEGSRGAWDVEDMEESSEILQAPIETPVIKKLSEPIRPDSNKVTRRSLNRTSNDGSSEDEYVVEKILAKRFNPRKKYYEYLLKWEGYPHEQNTWEPVHNMAACDKLVETFERNLAKQKAAQQTQQAQIFAQKTITNAQSMAARKVIGQSIREPGLESGAGPSGMESRPVRSSKKKALEQVKSWCGSMAKTTEFGKRKVGESSDSDDDDMDDIMEKKVKLEPRDDDDWSSGELACSQGSSGEENVVAIHGNQAKVVGVIHKAKEHVFAPVVKRSPGRPRKIRPDEAGGAINGMKPRKPEDTNDLAVKLGLESDSSPESKSRSPQPGNKITSQPPVLVANSKGVIKVDPRQVPNLTSGVYIVANKSNVVKLESLPGSPPKGKMGGAKTPPSKTGEASLKPGMVSGIVRKSAGNQGNATRLRPLAPAPPPVKLLPKPAPGQLAGVLLGGPGLMKVAPQLTQRTVVAPSPRGVASAPRILGPRPTAILQPRGAILQGTLRPQTPTATSVKRPIGIPGVQTKITSAVRPRLPTAGKVVSPLTAQTKSGVKPIQAMLGKAVQGQTLSSPGLLVGKKNGEGLVKTGVERLTLTVPKAGVRIEEERPRKGLGRGRGRGNNLTTGNDSLGKCRDSKLSESDNLHMEFHEVSSSESDSGDSLPELPMGEVPSLEPDSPPRPFTLCPETGKILSRAEGEPSPPPSPPRSVPATTAAAIPVPTSGPTPAHAAKEDTAGPAPGANESEEILPDRRESSPLPYAESNETLLKVEMSPGGTTGTVIESSVADSQYVDTLRTEQGVTVTKIPAELGMKSTEQATPSSPRAASPTAGKAGGGISVPARKLFMDGGKLNTPDVVTVTGEDGVVYQIATEGQEDVEGGDGMQQCVYVTTDQAEGSEEGAVLTLDTAVAEAVAQLMPDQVNVIGGGCSQFYIKDGEGNSVVTDNSEQLVMASLVEQPSNDDNAQVVAHVVQEGEIIPGTGKRRVVLLLPDGNLMMTDVDEEQYAALNSDK